MKNSSDRKKIFAALLAFVSFVAIAATITINTADTAYRNLSNVQGTNIYTDGEIRAAAGFQLAGAYRAVHGVSQLPQGSQFKVIWQDGSSEKYMVVSRYLSAGTTPIPNTQQGAPSAGGGGGIPDPGAGGDGPGGDWSDCFNTTIKACTSAGGGPDHCEYITSLECPGMG